MDIDPISHHTLSITRGESKGVRIHPYHLFRVKESLFSYFSISPIFVDRD